jgi:hypothetical protein
MANGAIQLASRPLFDQFSPCKCMRVRLKVVRKATAGVRQAGAGVHLTIEPSRQLSGDRSRHICGESQTVPEAR